MITYEDGTTSLKPEVKWTDAEDEEYLGNSKALNAIFNFVDKNMFRLINTCSEAKEDWEILKNAHEGTSKVQMSRLQLLTTKFKNLRMKEEESIYEFHIRFRDIANTSFALRKRCMKKSFPGKFSDHYLRGLI